MGRRKSILFITLATLLTLGVLFVHLVLPLYVLGRLNNYLETFSPVYGGHIQKMEMSVLRMAYRFEQGRLIFKKDGHTFLNLRSADVSISWTELFHGRILTDVVFEQAEVFLTKELIEGSKGPEAKPKDSAKEVADTLFPIDIARLELNNSSIEFSKLIGESDSTLWRISDVRGKALNVNPTPQNPLTFFTLNGTILKSSIFKLAGKMRRSDQPMAAEADVEVHNFDLVAANPILLKYVPLTFAKGKLDLYSEVLSEKGEVHGYVKPFFKNVQVIASKQEYKNTKHFFMEILVAIGNSILRKRDDKTVAAKIPFHSEKDHLEFDESYSLSTALEHGFDESLVEGIEDNVNLGSSK
jgi:hypothetical protein